MHTGIAEDKRRICLDQVLLSYTPIFRLFFLCAFFLPAGTVTTGISPSFFRNTGYDEGEEFNYMKNNKITLIIVGLCIGFLIGFVKRVIVYPNKKHNFRTYPRFAIAGQTVTFETAELTDDMYIVVSANVDELVQISETVYQFKMPFHDVYLDAKLVNGRQ